jgi:peroxiredoxin
MRPDIIPGAPFPDYELTDHTTKRRKLSELQGPHPMVLVLSRGAYCPKDHRQSELLAELYREMEIGYCRLVTISTDNITETNENRTGVGAQWPFLSDAARRVQKDLDIAEYTDPGHNPMIPHVIVLEPGLIVYNIYNGYWFFGPPHHGGATPGPPRHHKKVPPRLGHHHTRNESSMERRPQRPLLPLWQNLRPNLRRTGLTHSRARPRFTALSAESGVRETPSHAVPSASQ